MKKLLLVLAFFAIIQSVKPPREGINGQVFWISGDQMPGPGKVLSPQQGVIREILIYDRVTVGDVKLENQFARDITGEPIASVWSKQDGTFSVKVAPGTYSVFTREPAGFFANTVDNNGCINCVVVKPKQFSWVVISIDYEATY